VILIVRETRERGKPRTSPWWRKNRLLLPSHTMFQDEEEMLQRALSLSHATGEDVSGSQLPWCNHGVQGESENQKGEKQKNQ